MSKNAYKCHAHIINTLYVICKKLDFYHLKFCLIQKLYSLDKLIFIILFLAREMSRM